MLKIVENKGVACTFNEERHTYTTNKGQELISGTYFVSRFFEKFDSEKIAEAYARRHMLEKLQVLAMWREKGERSANFGTKVHYFAECKINNDYLNKPCEIPLPGTPDEVRAYENVERAIKELSAFLDFVECEKVVFSPKMGLAGMIDLVCKTKDGKNLVIVDWKTNDGIDFRNKYGRKGLFHLSEYDDCSFVKYSLQLSLYEKIIVDEKFYPELTKNPVKKILVNVNENDLKIIPVDSGMFENVIEDMVNFVSSEAKESA